MPRDAGEIDPLAQARQEIQDLISDSEQTRWGVGATADGLVRVTAENGRLTQIDIDSKALRMTPAELADSFAEAANAALADLESKYPVVGLPNIDLAALAADLAEAQDRGARQMRRYLETIADAQDGR
jgi:DNA-binding protein YbaB